MHKKLKTYEAWKPDPSHQNQAGALHRTSLDPILMIPHHKDHKIFHLTDTHTKGPLQILCSSNQIIIKSRNVTFFAIFWKRFSSGGGRGAKGCHRCYILAPPWRGRTRTHFTSCTMCTTSLSLTYHRPGQSRPWSLSVLQLSWFVLFNDSLNQTSWRSTKNSIYYTQNNRDRTCFANR